MIRRSALALSLAILTAVGGLTAPNIALAQANISSESRYSAIVVDAQSGEVLYAKRADSPRYPASITKVMTLYLTFEALAQGKINLSDRVTMSRNAASKQPTKLGLAAGQSLTVEDAIQALAIQSANDVATAMAEHLGGTESRFATMMTLRAQELGMTNTRYVNASGLPDSRQISSARDIAILSRSIMRDYPQYYSYLGQRQFSYAGRTMNNHNGLLARLPGVDGLKTGFTSASGYNLAASQVQNGHRLITVVLGGTSNAQRDSQVSELLRVGFDVVRRREAGEEITVAQNLFEPKDYQRLEASDPVGLYQVATADRAGEGDDDAVMAPIANPTAAVTRQAEAPRAKAPAGRYVVQVGAFKQKSDAQSQLKQVARRFSQHFDDAETRVADRLGGFFRAQFTGLTADAARSACAALKAKRLACMVIAP